MVSKASIIYIDLYIYDIIVTGAGWRRVITNSLQLEGQLRREEAEGGAAVPGGAGHAAPGRG